MLCCSSIVLLRNASGTYYLIISEEPHAHIFSEQYRKRPIAVRDISVDLKKQMEIDLKLERSSVISEQPHARIFSEQYVCCDAVIEDICCRASYISCVDDMSSITLLRPELRHRFYSKECSKCTSCEEAEAEIVFFLYIIFCILCVMTS